MFRNQKSRISIVGEKEGSRPLLLQVWIPLKPAQNIGGGKKKKLERGLKVGNSVERDDLKLSGNIQIIQRRVWENGKQSLNILL